MMIENSKLDKIRKQRVIIKYIKIEYGLLEVTVSAQFVLVIAGRGMI